MGLFTKLNQKYINWYIKREREKKLTEDDKKRLAFVNKMRELYNFVKWLNEKGLPNRQQRKSFWRNVKEGQPVLENALKNLIEVYSKPKNQVKVTKPVKKESK